MEGGDALKKLKAFSVGLWKDVRRRQEEFTFGTSIVLSNGDRTNFWVDKGGGEQSLKKSFPTQFILASPRNVLRVDTREWRSIVLVIPKTFLGLGNGGG